MKKFLKWSALGFVVYYMISQPHNAANVVHTGVGGVTGAANGLSTFVNNLP